MNKKIALTLIWIQLFQIALFTLHFAEIEHRYSIRANDFVDFFSNSTEFHRDIERTDGLPVVSSACCHEECSEDDCPAMHSLSKRFSNDSNTDLGFIVPASISGSAGSFLNISLHIINILHIAPKNSPPK